MAPATPERGRIPRLLLQKSRTWGGERASRLSRLQISVPAKIATFTRTHKTGCRTWRKCPERPSTHWMGRAKPPNSMWLLVQVFWLLWYTQPRRQVDLEDSARRPQGPRWRSRSGDAISRGNGRQLLGALLESWLPQGAVHPPESWCKLLVL